MPVCRANFPVFLKKLQSIDHSNRFINTSSKGHIIYQLVAHNSFMHSAAELGLVGMYCFVGLFYWLFVTTGAARNVEGAAASPLALDCWASGIGTLVCVCFLSRQYSPVLYVPIARGAVRVAVDRKPGTPDAFWTRAVWLWLLLLTAGSLVVIYIAVRLFAE